jgi:hypothetical protein
MAKALYGHVGSAPDRRMLDEVTKLRARVRDLEFEVMRLRAENDRLAEYRAPTLEVGALPFVPSVSCCPPHIRTNAPRDEPQ